MISELESIRMKEKWTDADRRRMQELKQKSVKRISNSIRQFSPSVADQLDKIQDIFGNKVEPWTKFSCSVCKETYHLVDGAKCSCGAEESKKRFTKYLGEVSNGTK